MKAQQSRFFAAVFILAIGAQLAWAQSAAVSAHPVLKVEKIDPPNWWIGLPDPMLLIKGEGLTDAKVTTSVQGVTVKRVENGLGGEYLFVWLHLSPTAKAGDLSLSITAGSQAAKAAFHLENRSSGAKSPQPGGGFNGIGLDDVIYPVGADQMSPTLRDIQAWLTKLKDLGVTTIMLDPLYKSEAINGVTGPVDLYSVAEKSGTLQDYKDVVQAAHALGMKVILDFVANHVGPSHPWAEAPPNTRWFHGSKQKHLKLHSPIEALTDPHASPRFWRDVEEGWVADEMPDLNTDDRWVSQYLRQNAMWWAETGKLDGFRLDDVPYVDRMFWHDFSTTMQKDYPRLQTVGEIPDGDPSINSYFAGGKSVEGIDTGLDTVLDFPLSFAIRDVVNHGAPATKLMEVLGHDWMYPHPESLVTFIGERGGLGGQGPSKDKLELALTLLLTLRGIPEIYGGEVVAQSAQAPDQEEIPSHIKKLLQLRREHIALRQGKQYHIDAGDDFYAFSRVYLGAPSGLQGPKTERLLVIFNNAGVEKHFSLPLADTPLETAETATALLGSAPAKVADTHLMVDVPARSVVVYEVQCGCDL